MLAESTFYCEYGCCGEQYKQQCCNFTLQIIGTVVGLVIFLTVVTSVTYYCCRKKSQHGGSRFGSLLVRFGIRPNPTTTTVATVNNRPPGSHHFRGNGRHYGSPQLYGPMPPGYMPLPPRLPTGHQQLYGGAVDPAYPANQPFVSPTTPLPPSYSFEPPHVYFLPKVMSPPPAYDSISHVNPAFKHDDNGGTMPTPSM
ncbi:hypothetical protein ACJMK2_017205 [Sinanodonta woodiana]|uniref:Uncharacterized protein n=1 Tax=Sinanodonta woodiana TaxID=1069815 RepID=A0ABD3UW43_SINWO